MAFISVSVSIVVPVYNRPVELANLLQSFDGLKGLIPCDIVIVDDCSTDNTPMIAKEWVEKPHSFKAIYHKMEKNSGPAKARNAGIRLASGEAIAFTDSDCIADPFWLERLYQKLKSDQGYAGAGGWVYPVNNDIYSRYYTYAKTLLPPRGLEFLVGANCMFWRRCLDEAGGFDEGVSIPGGEEVSLCFRLYNKGYRFGFEEGAVIRHDYRQNLSSLRKTSYNYGYGNRQVFDKFSQEYPDPIKNPSVHYRILQPPMRNFRTVLNDQIHHFKIYRRNKLPKRYLPVYNILRFFFYQSYGQGWENAGAK